MWPKANISTFEVIVPLSFAFLFPGTSVHLSYLDGLWSCLGRQNIHIPRFTYPLSSLFSLVFQILQLKCKHLFLFFSPLIWTLLYFSVFNFSFFSHIRCTQFLLLSLPLFVLCLLSQALLSKTSRLIFGLGNSFYVKEVKKYFYFDSSHFYNPCNNPLR